MTTQDTQVLDQSSLDDAAASVCKEIEAKEKAAVAARVFDEKSPVRLAPKRLLTQTAVWEPSKAIKKEPVIKKEPLEKASQKPLVEPPQRHLEEPPQKPLEEPPQKPLEEPPQKPLEEPPEKPLVEPPQKPLVEPPQKPLVEPPQKPLVEPPQKTLEEPAAMPLVELRVPIKKEPIDHPIKMEPGVKQEAKAKDEVRCPGFAAAVESEGGPDVPGVESPGPDAAQGNDNGDGRRGTDERDDGREMPRPALLSTAGVVSPGDQKPAGKKSKKKKEADDETASKTKTPPKKATKEPVAEPKRRPGRPRKNETQPKAKAKAKVAKAETPEKKAGKKRKTRERDTSQGSQDTKFYSPEEKSGKAKAPKAKAKPKAKAASSPAKTRAAKAAPNPSKTRAAKAAPSPPKTRAVRKRAKKNEVPQDGAMKSRKSCAYHKAKGLALKQGLSKEEAIVLAKKVTWFSLERESE